MKISTTQRDCIRGFGVFQYTLGVTGASAKAAVEALEESRKEFTYLLKEASLEQSKLCKKFGAKIEKLDERSARVSKLLLERIKSRRQAVSQFQTTVTQQYMQERSNLLTSTNQEVQSLLIDTKQEVQKFRSFMEEQIALQVPINYWSGKRWWHRVSTFVFAFVFVAYCAAAGIFSYYELYQGYGGISGFLDHWKDASLSVFGAMAAMLAIVMIFARVLYRLFASQLHLWNDASERITMIETYLALAERGHAKEEFLGALMARLLHLRLMGSYEMTWVRSARWIWRRGRWVENLSQP